jgi:cytochrome c nitrite reductase small subunit
MLGSALGVGAFTFNHAQGSSYLSDDPAACRNCHIMRQVYEAWSRSSHQAVATCNDCHTPHAFLGKWFVKGLNGWNHSLAFTTGSFPEPIRIRPFNIRITQGNCLECHAVLVSDITAPSGEPPALCTDCHGSVGHRN